ncbi:hypothetical protein M885DRAFT_505749 [Pelagophyceae sp. CCMP2097]|nr:hypothetical protein M885DRAFT_505749 [Pelagophyceae sp. CCMP2097]
MMHAGAYVHEAMSGVGRAGVPGARCMIFEFGDKRTCPQPNVSSLASDVAGSSSKRSKKDSANSVPSGRVGLGLARARRMLFCVERRRQARMCTTCALHLRKSPSWSPRTTSVQSTWTASTKPLASARWPSLARSLESSATARVSVSRSRASAGFSDSLLTKRSTPMPLPIRAAPRNAAQSRTPPGPE